MQVSKHTLSDGFTYWTIDFQYHCLFFFDFADVVKVLPQSKIAQLFTFKNLN
jgi:hypothetical protein